MARPRECEYIDTACAYCDKPLERPLNKRNKERKRAFCNQVCFWAWLREKRPYEEIWHAHEQGELLAELQRVANDLERLPTMAEMKELGNIYPSTYQKRFGSWYMALACITDPSPETAWDISQVDPEDGAWVAGISDGESTFRLGKHKSSFTCIWGFQLRADDVGAAIEIKRILGLSKRPLGWWIRDTDRKRGVNAGDAVRFFVRDIPTLSKHVIPFFQRFPLRSKKRKEFPLFAEAVDLLYNHQKQGLHKRYSKHLKKRLAELKNELEVAKKYTKPSELDEYIDFRRGNPISRRMSPPRV